MVPNLEERFWNERYERAVKRSENPVRRTFTRVWGGLLISIGALSGLAAGYRLRQGEYGKAALEVAVTTYCLYRGVNDFRTGIFQYWPLRMMKEREDRRNANNVEQ